MLAGQQRRRHHDCDLHAIHGREEGSAQSYFRLAETNVTADQAIHRATGAQIVPNGIDGILLVFRFIIREACGEFVIETIRRNQCRRMAHHAGRSDADKLVGHIQQALLQLGLAHLPRAAAQLVQMRFGSIRAVAGQQVDVFDGQEQLCLIGIMQLQASPWRTRCLDRLQPYKAANAVFGVNDQRAFIKPRNFGNEIRATLAALGATGL